MNEQHEKELRASAMDLLRAAVSFGQTLIWILDEETDDEDEDRED